MKRETFIVLGGSFNPPTIAHQRLMTAALDALGADRGYFAPSSDAYVRAKMRRAKRPDETLSEATRLKMLQAIAEDDPRFYVDDGEYRREKTSSFELTASIQAQNPNATVYFLAGGDKIEQIARWRSIEEFLRRFRFLIVKRDGDDPESRLRRNKFLSMYAQRFTFVDAPDGVEGVSSTAVRQLYRSGGTNEARASLHPKVWEILEEIGGFENMKCKTENLRDGNTAVVKRFRGDYYFLSNFYEAPVRYDGLRYTNNEAAFQAQKCLTEEEKKRFTTLGPGEAKRLGRRVKLRPDWDEVRIGIMEGVVRAKFNQNAELRRLLLATGDAELREGNTWRDMFWGVDLETGRGRNELGKILMKLRDDLRAEMEAEKS